MIERQFAPATQYIIGIYRLARIQPFVEQTSRIFIVRRGGRGAGGHRQAGGGAAGGGRRIQQRVRRRLVVVVRWQTNVMRLDDEVLRLERIRAVVVVVVMMMMGWMMMMMMMISTRLSMVRVMIHSLCPTHTGQPRQVQLQQHTLIGGQFPRQNKQATDERYKTGSPFFLERTRKSAAVLVSEAPHESWEHGSTCALCTGVYDFYQNLTAVGYSNLEDNPCSLLRTGT
jgi:hypothetical protein